MLFVVASESPTNSSFAISFANDGPDIVASFLVFNFFLTIELANIYVSCSIPLDAIIMCLSLTYGFILSQTLDKNLVATASTTISLPSIAFSIFSV